MLKISDNRRYIVHDDGTPFFYLGDTAWELLYRLDREEVETYLQNRAAKKFTVIQIVGLVEYGFEKPNRNGHTAFINNDPLQPNEDYFAYADWVVSRANELGLTIGFLPTWGDKWNKAWGHGPEVFTPENARAYGKWLGERYRDADLIWILGGDREIETDNHIAIIRAMAAGLAQGDGGTHLRTFHPSGSRTSSIWLHEDEWLDFNMWQTGHDRNRDSYNCIAADYNKTPVKPTLDAEPGYEDHPAAFDSANGYLNDHDVRKYAYGGVFAGACGHTYGCHDIWQFFNAAWSPGITWARTPWQKAIDLPGAGQMQHLRALIESRPYLNRIPDQELIASDPGLGGDHIQATRDAEGRFALIYSASGKSFAIDLTKLSPKGRIAIHWFDPRTGEARFAGHEPAQKIKEFNPPTSGPGNDWVLALTDEICGFPDPGAAVYEGV